MVFHISVIVNSITPVVVFMQDVFLFFLIKDECSFVYFLSKKGVYWVGICVRVRACCVCPEILHIDRSYNEV